MPAVGAGEMSTDVCAVCGHPAVGFVTNGAGREPDGFCAEHQRQIVDAAQDDERHANRVFLGDSLSEAMLVQELLEECVKRNAALISRIEAWQKNYAWTK